MEPMMERLETKLDNWKEPRSGPTMEPMMETKLDNWKEPRSGPTTETWLDS